MRAIYMPVALALALAGCGAEQTDDRAVRRDGDNISIDLGDGIGTVTADGKGVGGFAGMGGTIGVTGPGGAAPKLPGGLTLPPGSTVTSSMAPNLPGMTGAVIVEADNSGTISDVAGHFRAQAKALGMAIERDGTGAGEYVVSAGAAGQPGFMAVIKPNGAGSSYVLTAR